MMLTIACLPFDRKVWIPHLAQKGKKKPTGKMVTTRVGITGTPMVLGGGTLP